MSGEFDATKDSQSKKFERRPRIFVKPDEMMNSQPSFLFLTNLNLMNYDHIIKSI